MMQASIQVSKDPVVQYLLRLGDTCLIHAQRLSEWCGHAPVLEEDIALTNIALDLVGQARAVLTHAGRLHGPSDRYGEDQLAFLRDERDYLNLTMVELPRGDFAFAMVRNFALATFLKLLWGRLAASSDKELAGIAEKALKEARYHQEHAADWVIRLGDGTDESRRRTQAALQRLWPYTAEIFEADIVDEQAAASGIGPRWADLHDAWRAEISVVLTDATLNVPTDSPFRSNGKQGRHSEHMGYILTEMQYLQRTFPGAVW
jgi:ring-1,2-phenylacetyl-CoA epoxidase subunit PaaC